jgi:HSP90 family molecular chaperone
MLRIMVSPREQQQKKETTRSITYRLPEKMIDELDGVAKQKKNFSKCIG